MHGMWYQVHVFLDGEWRTFKDEKGVVQFGNKYSAQQRADELCTLGQAIDAFVCRVEVAQYCCVVTRQLMTQTTYTGVV